MGQASSKQDIENESLNVRQRLQCSFLSRRVLREVSEARLRPDRRPDRHPVVVGLQRITRKKKIPVAGVRALTSHCPVGSNSVILVYLAFVGAIAPRWFGADVVRWSAFQLPLV
jgi:hypothetical protein